jgi:hypothetical protein
MANAFGELAYKVWDGEFAEDQTSEIHRRTQTDYMSGWLESNLGQLNILLDTTLSGTGASISIEQQSVFYEMYMLHWYKKQARNVLKGIASSSDFISLRDQDTSITRNNRNESAKTYYNLIKSTQDKIDDLVIKYRTYEFSSVGPLQVAGIDATISPSTS